MTDKLDRLSRCVSPAMRLAWWRAIIPRQQARIDAMLLESNRISAHQMEIIKLHKKGS